MGDLAVDPAAMPWKGFALAEDPKGTDRLVATFQAELTSRGRAHEAGFLDKLRVTIAEGETQGEVLRTADGEAVGVRLWSDVEGVGRKISFIYLAPGHQRPSDWEEFWSSTLSATPTSQRPYLIFGDLPWLSFAEAQEILARWGYRGFQRFELAFPKERPVPPDPAPPAPAGRCRPLKKEDSADLSHLQQICYQGTFDSLLFEESPDPGKDAAEGNRKILEGEYGTFLGSASFVWEVDGHVVGATMVVESPERKLLANVMVHPERQGGGLARRLILQSLRAVARMPGSGLHLAVTRENAGADHLYRSMGFEPFLGPYPVWALESRLPPTRGTGPASPKRQ